MHVIVFTLAAVIKRVTVVTCATGTTSKICDTRATVTMSETAVTRVTVIASEAHGTFHGSL